MAIQINIGKRKFSGNSIPVGSYLGKLLLNRKDSNKLMDAVKASLNGNTDKAKIKITDERVLKELNIVQ
jgi:hypothetical protein